jgi:hypothetical protein
MNHHHLRLKKRHTNYAIALKQESHDDIPGRSILACYNVLDVFLSASASSTKRYGVLMQGSSADPVAQNMSRDRLET